VLVAKPYLCSFAALVLGIAWGVAGCGEATPEAASQSAVAKPDAGPPDFATDVAPLLYKKCATCHHEGGPGPFPLIEYGDVSDHGKQIVDVTHSGYMPPWLPKPGDIAFEYEQQRRLTDTEKKLLADWVAAGMPSGDLARTPAPPKFEVGWQLGEPDLILEAEYAFELQPGGADIYRNFVISVPDGPPRFVKAVELQPGSPAVVHHSVMRIDTTGELRKLDAADPAPGFDGMVFGAARMPGGRFIGWTPGKTPDPGSEDRSWQLTGGADLVVQVHLRPSGKPETIRPKVGLHFATRPPTRFALSMDLSSSDIDIAPGETNYRVTDTFELPADVDLISVYPHAHYIGKELDGYVVLPDGTRRMLVEIDDWDFDWQDAYRLVTPLRLPKGSVIHMDYRYDNSADNPRNPTSPPKRVTYGQNSTDEMAELILELEPVNPADLELLDATFMKKWLDGQIMIAERRLAAADGKDPQQLAALGALLANAGQWEAARGRYEASLALRDEPGVRVELALVYARLENMPAAETQLDAALAADPNFTRAHLVRGNNARLAGRYADAIASYERTIALDPAHAEAHNNLGVTYEKLDQPARAAESFARAVEAAPARGLFHENHARALEAAARYTEAIDAYGRALERSPGSIKAMRGLAWLLATHPDSNHRDPVRALQVAEMAARMTGLRSPEILEAVAASLAAGGRLDEARDVIGRAIELATAGNRPDLVARYRGHLATFEAGQIIVADAVR
jgi:tetratricopeptide (TPR) repeat protein